MKSDYQKVYKFVAKIRRNHILKRTIDGCVCGGGLFFAISVLLNLLFFLYPVTIIPLIWDIVAVSYFGFVVVWITDSIFIHKLHIIETAKRIEQKGRLEHPLVSIALELKNTDQQNFFTQKACSGAVRQLTKLPKSFYVLKQWKIYSFAFIFAVWIVTNLTIAQTVTDYWKMPFAFLNNGNAVVSPGTVTLPRNASVNLQLKPSGVLFPSCMVDIASVKTGQGRKRLIRHDSTGVFLYAEDSVRESFMYRFTYGSHIFNPETIWVANPPMLYGLKIRVVSPKYTGLAERELPEDMGDCSVYAGTKVKIELPSERLANASLVVNGDTSKMTMENSKAVGEFTAYNQIAYTFSLQDTLNQLNDSLPTFYIDMIPDEKPFVHFLKPALNKVVNVNLVEPLCLEAVDDLGVKSLKICYYKNGEENEVPQVWNIPIDRNQKTIQKELEWSLTELSLYPGDTVFYWAQASDYCQSKQSRVSKSDTFWFRLASFEEIHEQVVGAENSAQKTISDVRKTQDDLGELIKDVVKQASGENELTWDQKQILDKVNETIKAQTDSLQSAINSLQENIEKFKKEGELGDEVVEKMNQIQDALQDLIDQFGDSLFANNDNQMITMENMQKAVEKLDKMLPKLNEQLDNTLQYLEMLKHDRELAALALRAENLAKEQSKLSEAVNKGENLANQEKLLERISRFSKELSSKANSDKMPSSERIDSLQSKMQSQISQNQSPSMGQMNSMSNELMQMSQKLRQMMNSTKMEQMQAERKRLLDLIDDVLDIAQWQEEIGAQVNTIDKEARARFQQTVNDAVKKTRQKTEDLSIIPPIVKKQISQGFIKISESSEEILKHFATAFNETKQIKNNVFNLYSLANLLISIEGALSEAQSQGGSSGGMSDLRKLSAQQMAINAATSELLRAMMSGGKGSQQSEGQPTEGNTQAQIEAQKAQEAIAEELEKLAEKFGKDGNKMGNNVDELEKEARKLAEMLRNPDKDLVNRQDRFLSRMLQAALSLHKQDDGKDDRKSRVASNTFKEQESVQSDKVIKDADTFYMLRRKALQGNFPESYRTAVKAYFDSLEVKFLGDKK